MIGLDLDGVLYDFYGTWTTVWEGTRGPLPGRDLSQPYNHMARMCGMQSDAEWWAWFDMEVGWPAIRPYPQAVEAAPALTEPAVALTNRPAGALPATVRAVRGDFPSIRGVFFVDDKTNIPVDLWVDDNPAVIRQVAERHGADRVVAILHPWTGVLPAGVAVWPDFASWVGSSCPGEAAGSPRVTFGDFPGVPTARTHGTTKGNAYRRGHDNTA